MYVHFKGKKHIPLWCDGKESATDSCDEWPLKKQKKSKDKDTHSKRVNEQEQELESVFHKLREKHGSKWSGPQYRLWARAIVSGVHDSDSQPPNAPMFTGSLQNSRKSPWLMHLQVLPLQ